MDPSLSFVLILTGLTGIHSISTISKVSVKAGASISIPCLYDSKYTNHVKYLCKGYYWSSCSYAIKTNQPNSGKFSISDDKKQRIFTVTVKDVTYQDTDYWCIVEINGGSDVGAYFHLSVVRDKPSLNVENQQIKAFKRGNVTISCSHQNSGEMKWCKLGRNCVTGSSGSIDGTRVSINPKPSRVFNVTMSGLKTESSGWYMCVKGDLQMPVHVTVDEQPTTMNPASTTVEDKGDSVPVDLMSFIIPLTLLFFTVMVALIIWFILKRRKQTKAETLATTTENTVTTKELETKLSTFIITNMAEEEVTYSAVKEKKKTSEQRSTADTKSDVDVTYSSVVTGERQTSQRVEPKAEDVLYSTIAQHQ